MKSLFFLLFIAYFIFSPVAYSRGSIRGDEIFQLKILNKDLLRKLDEASTEIMRLRSSKESSSTSESVVQELEKTKRDLANQSCEIKMLREKMMISKDFAYNGE